MRGICQMNAGNLPDLSRETRANRAFPDARKEEKKKKRRKEKIGARSDAR